MDVDPLYHRGCPNTEMRKYREAFEADALVMALELNLHMKHDAPHYSSAVTRKAYDDWVIANDAEWRYLNS